MTRITLRIDFAADRRIGPGKILLLEKIMETGSISAAGRALDMSYRRAWLLVDALNRMFREPVVTTTLGGRAGGGADVTPFGERVVQHYRAMEAATAQAVTSDLRSLEAALTP